MILTCTVARSSAPCTTTFPDMFHCDTVGAGNNVAASKLVSHWYTNSVPGSHSCKAETVPATTVSNNTVTPAHSVNHSSDDTKVGGRRFSETLVHIYQTIQHLIPQDRKP